MTPSEVTTDWLWNDAPSPVLHVEGMALSEARQLLRSWAPSLSVEAPSGTFAEAACGFRPYLETLIDRLVRIEDLVVSDDLQRLLDEAAYNPRLSRLFEDLWTARFEYRENRSAIPVVAELMRQTFDEGTALLRSDALLLWLAFMGQNYSATPGKISLLVGCPPDGDLTLFLTLAKVWHAFGCPLRILVLN